MSNVKEEHRFGYFWHIGDSHTKLSDFNDQYAAKAEKAHLIEWDQSMEQWSIRSNGRIMCQLGVCINSIGKLTTFHSPFSSLFMTEHTHRQKARQRWFRRPG
jgi:hypothetical protein